MHTWALGKSRLPLVENQAQRVRRVHVGEWPCRVALSLDGVGGQCRGPEWTGGYRPIVDYIDAQFENYLQEELKIRRSLFDYHDTRIHVCLYFITPTGHSLKSLDLVTMKKLDSKVWPPSGGSCGRPVHGGGVWSLPVTVRCIPRGLGLGACRIGLVLLLYLLLCLSLCLQPAPVDLTSSELCPCLWPWAPSLQLR